MNDLRVHRRGRVLLLLGVFVAALSALAGWQAASPVQAQGTEYSLRLYVEEQSFTLFVSASSPVSLNGLQFRVVNSEGQFETIEITDRFDALRLSNGVAQPGSCFIYILRDAEAGSLGFCSNPLLNYRVVVERGDVFWYDFASNRQRDVAVFRDGEIIQICPWTLTNCPIIHPTITPSYTVTYTPSPTLTSTQTFTPTSTETPTPSPTLTPTPTVPPQVTQPVEIPTPAPTVIPSPTQTGDGPLSPNPVAFRVMSDLRNPGRINQVAWSPDGRFLVSAHANGSLCVWNGITFGETSLGCIEDAHRGGVNAVSWSPDGVHFASVGADGPVRIWQIDQNGAISQVRDNLEGNSGPVYDVSWSQDPNWPRLITAGGDGKLFVWDTLEWREAQQNIPYNSPRALTWIDDGRAAAVNNIGGIHIITLPHSSEIIDTYQGQVIDIAWDSISNIATVGEDGVVRLYVAPQPAASVSFCADLPRCDYIRLAQNLRGPSTLSFSPDGSLLAVGALGGAHVIEGRPPYRLVDVYMPSSPNTQITSIAWNPEGTILAGADDQGHIYLWVIAQQAPDRIHPTVTNWPVTTNGAAINAFTWSPNEPQIAVVDNSRSLSILDVQTLQRLGVVQHDNGVPRSVDWNPTRPLIASGGCDPTANLWDISNPAQIVLRAALNRPDQHRDCVTGVAFSPHGDFLATADRAGLLRVWDGVNPDEYVAPQRNLMLEIGDLGWNADGSRLAAVSDTGVFVVWDMVGNQAVEIFRRQPYPFMALNALAWSPDDLLVATGSGVCDAPVGCSVGSSWSDPWWIAVWNISSEPNGVGFNGAHLLLQLGDYPVKSLSWRLIDNHSRLIGLDTNGAIYIWDGATGELLAKYTYPSQSVPTQVQWSPVGSTFATADNVGNMWLWNFSER